MGTLVLCRACRRHVREGALGCPFCGCTELVLPPDGSSAAPRRWAAATRVVLGTLVTVSCGPAYGAPARCIDDDDGVNHCAVQPVCGDGYLEGAEACDDGNAVDEDACTAACQPNVCGDGICNPDGEPCESTGPEADCGTFAVSASSGSAGGTGGDAVGGGSAGRGGS